MCIYIYIYIYIYIFQKVISNIYCILRIICITYTNSFRFSKSLRASRFSQGGRFLKAAGAHQLVCDHHTEAVLCKGYCANSRNVLLGASTRAMFLRV